MEKIFITGLARGGTSLVQQLLATHSKIVGVNETEILKKIDGSEYIKEVIDVISETDKEKKLVNKEIDHLNNPYDFLDEYCSAHAKYFGKKYYVEKSPIHSFFIRGILKNIENSKIIVILRNPCAIVASRLFARKTCRGKKYGFPRWLRFLLNLSEVLFTFKHFNKLNESGRLIFIKYSKLVKYPEVEMKRVFAFIGLETERVWENIEPKDLRMKARKIGHIMNSSFSDNRNKANKISTQSLYKYREVLSKGELNFIKKVFRTSRLSLVKKEYPNLIGKFSFLGLVFAVFSKLDFRIFLLKNIKNVKIRKI